MLNLFYNQDKLTTPLSAAMKSISLTTTTEEFRGADLLISQIILFLVTLPVPSVLIAYNVGRSYPLLTKTVSSLKTGRGTTE